LRHKGGNAPKAPPTRRVSALMLAVFPPQR
jgi:hypothetical protein